MKPVVLKTEEGTADQVAARVEKLNEFNLKSDKAYSLIALSVEKHLQVHVSTKETPKEAWDSLGSQFNFVSFNQMVRLNQRFFRAKMAEGGDLLKHITEMTVLAEQLKEMDDEIPSKFAVAVLGSLPESYDNFLTSMNTRDTDSLDWNSIRGALMEEYHKRKEKEKQKTDEEALYTNRFEHSSSSHDGNQGRGFNNNSNRGGFHNRGGFGRGGFSNRGGSNSNRGGSRGNFRSQRRHPYPFTGSCFNCQQVGHRANECPRTNTGEDQEEASFAETIFHEDDIALIACDTEEHLYADDSDLFYSSMSYDDADVTEQYGDYCSDLTSGGKVSNDGKQNGGEVNWPKSQVRDLTRLAGANLTAAAVNISNAEPEINHCKLEEEEEGKNDCELFRWPLLKTLGRMMCLTSGVWIQVLRST